MRTPGELAAAAGLRVRSCRAAVSVLLALASLASAQESALPPGRDEARVVRAYFDDISTAHRLVLSMESLESKYELGYIVLLATDDEIEALRRDGLRVEADASFSHVAEPLSVSQPAASPATISFRPCYRTVEGTYESARRLVDRHPKLATLTDGGDSWFKQDGRGGYDLLVLKLTNSEASGPKPNIFITAGLHAREVVTSEFALRFAERMAEAYQTDADARWMLDRHTVHLMLHANPDGRKKAEEWIDWRKNRNLDRACDDPRYSGVDLNRNFEHEFGGRGASGRVCDLNYRGPSAASEPETQAVIAYLNGIFPDARGPEADDAAPASTSGIYIDLHSHGRLILWPWGYTYARSPNQLELWFLAKRMAQFNGHSARRSADLYRVSGTAIDHAYGELGVASFIFELGTEFFEHCSSFQNSILDQNIAALRYALSVARTPYVTPAGPLVLDPALGGTASTTGVPAGTVVTLRARLDEQQRAFEFYSLGRIFAGGSYTVDAPPWDESAEEVALTPTDGEWDADFFEPYELAEASIDTTGWRPGRHTIFVRAQNVLGEWGAVRAVFLFVDMAPPDRPAAPSVIPGDTDLTVRWTEPAHNGSALTGYLARYKPSGLDFGWSAVDPGTSREATITGLVTGEQYDVQVRARNAVGASSWSESSTSRPGTAVLAVGDAEAAESAGAIVFAVTLSAETDSEVTVDYTTADGTGAGAARAGSHYTARQGTLTFAAGPAAVQEVAVPILDDAVDEEREERTFTLTLTDAVNAPLASGGEVLSATGTIRDDDVPDVAVSFGSSGYEATEGESVVVRLRLTAPPERQVTIPLRLAHQGGATAADYSGIPASLTFASGETERQFVFAATDDDEDDEGEAVALTFGELPSQVSGGDGAILAIVDNDESPLPPEAAFEVRPACSGDPCRVLTGEAVTLADTSSGRVRESRWVFGDGTESSQGTVNHAWSEPGFYTVVLTVGDGETESTAFRVFLVEAANPAGTCEPDAETLCLQDSRYQARVSWWTGDGEGGPGFVVHEGTNDSGLFWFFGRDNWEVMIKVLDGCALNDHTWVFVASTTDLGHLVRVADTVTGTVREYRNEPGRPAPAITDTAAFPGGCDERRARSASARR